MKPEAHRLARRERPGVPARILALIPGPSLDGNLVLWREWHRKRPSRWTGRLWTAYAVVFGSASLLVLARYYLSPGFGGYDAAELNAWNVSFGLLMLTISAATALSEERDRGSLDVILATPLSTGTILLGKWWGTFALVPRLAILPVWVGAGMTLISGQVLGLMLMIGLILAYAASITSLGLAVATWESRPGRAVAYAVIVYVVLWMNLLIYPLWPLLNLVFYVWVDPRGWSWLHLLSPYFGLLHTTSRVGRLDHESVWRDWGSPSGVAVEALLAIGFHVVLALGLFAAAWLSFDRCLGRVPDRPRRPRRVPENGGHHPRASNED
jgi:hypothetical protein